MSFVGAAHAERFICNHTHEAECRPFAGNVGSCKDYRPLRPNSDGVIQSEIDTETQTYKWCRKKKGKTDCDEANSIGVAAGRTGELIVHAQNPVGNRIVKIKFDENRFFDVWVQQDRMYLNTGTCTKLN